MKHRTADAGRIALAAITALACLVACVAAVQAKPAKPIRHGHHRKGTTVGVMSRNVYLGADLGPALSAPNEHAFFEANGTIVRQVEATNFPVRAKGLAKEILEKIWSACRRSRSGARRHPRSGRS